MSTKTVSDILRDCAFALPRDEVMQSKAALGGYSKTSSPFICDYLEHTVCHEDHAQAAKEYLHSLGMGWGCGEFDYRNKDDKFTLRSQYQRCTWLFFAADLWDEGFRP